MHPSCITYQANVKTCKDDYTGETEYNIVTRWGENNNPAQNSEPAHLKNSLSHSFTWFIFANSSSNKRTHKALRSNIYSV